MAAFLTYLSGVVSVQPYVVAGGSAELAYREMMEESIGTGRANLITATALGCSLWPLQRCEFGAINDCQGKANHEGDYKSAKAGPLAQEPNTTDKLSKSIDAGDAPRIPPYPSRAIPEDEAKAALTLAKRAGVIRV